MVQVADKPLVWLAGGLKTPPLSKEARLEAGMLLRRLQRGELIGMPASRPMQRIGKRCHELRVVDENATWRVVYRLEPDAVVILEVFSKKDPEDTAGRDRRLQGTAEPLSQGAKGGMMDARKRQKLEADGWRVGSAADFLDLSPEESALIEFKLSLGRLVRRTRVRFRLSQNALARRLHSSQSRVAKVEAGDAGVSLDLMIRAALAAGAKRKELAQAIAPKRRAASG